MDESDGFFNFFLALFEILDADMPRVYKRKAGSRPYLTEYTEENMNKALSDVKNGRKSIRKAAAHYNVPYSTLNRR